MARYYWINQGNGPGDVSQGGALRIEFDGTAPISLAHGVHDPSPLITHNEAEIFWVAGGHSSHRAAGGL